MGEWSQTRIVITLGSQKQYKYWGFSKGNFIDQEMFQCKHHTYLIDKYIIGVMNTN